MLSEGFDLLKPLDQEQFGTPLASRKALLGVMPLY